MPDHDHHHHDHDHDRQPAHSDDADRTTPRPGELRLRGHRGRDPVAPAVLDLQYAAPAPPEETRRRRPRPISIGIALDRSGSMGGPPIACARAAALRLVDALGRRDTLSLGVFGGPPELLLPASPMDGDGRRAARAAIEGIRVMGQTPLHDGWRLVADEVERGRCHPRADRACVVLSDGMGNAGETHPAVLAREAAAVRSWDVRTTCVGIGEHYHSAQLGALAEGGGGGLHQASEPREIADAVLGELQRLRSVTLRAATAIVRLPHGTRVREVVGGRTWRRADEERGVVLEIDLGDLGPDRAAHAAVLLDLPLPEGDVDVRIEGVAADDERRAHAGAGGALSAILAGPDLDVAGRAASLWHDEVVRRAIERNEDGAYDLARELVVQVRLALCALARGTRDERDLARSLDRVERRAAAAWSGMARKEAHVAVMRNKMAMLDARSASGASERSAMSYLADDDDRD